MDRTEKIGSIYAAKRTPTPAETTAIKEYFKLFDEQAEPLYRANYYRLNPSFWEWLRGIVGQSIPKA